MNPIVLTGLVGAAWPFIAVWVIRSLKLIPGVVKDVASAFVALIKTQSVRLAA